MRRSFPMWILSWSMPNYFMAVSKAATEVSPEHKQLPLDIMGYINSREAQSLLFGDDNVLVTNIKDVTPVTSASTSGIQQTIREGRIITDFFLTAEPKLNTEARDMLTGNITVEQWLKNGAPDKPLRCQISGKRRQSTKIMVAAQAAIKEMKRFPRQTRA